MDNIYFRLSQREREQIEELETAFAQSKIIGLSDNEKGRLLDMLALLVERGIICSMDIDNTNAYRLVGNFENFWSWADDQEKKAKKLTRREYKVAFISAFLGWFIPFFITTIIPEVMIALKGGG